MFVINTIIIKRFLEMIPFKIKINTVSTLFQNANTHNHYFLDQRSKE